MTEKLFVSEKSDSTRILAGAAARLGIRKYSAVQLLIALIAMVVLIPFVESRHGHGDLIVTVLLTAVLLSAVVVTGSRRRIRLIAIILVTPAVLGRWIAALLTTRDPPLHSRCRFGRLCWLCRIVNLLQLSSRAPPLWMPTCCAPPARRIC